MIWGHPSEEKFACILDYKRIKWKYEPHMIVLKEKNGITVKGFRPDFYLPDKDLYIEISTAKNQGKKNRKMTMVADLYPHINIILLTNKRLERIFKRYDFLWPEENICDILQNE